MLLCDAATACEHKHPDPPATGRRSRSPRKLRSRTPMSGSAVASPRRSSAMCRTVRSLCRDTWRGFVLPCKICHSVLANIMDSLPQDCQELIAQLAAQSTSGGVSVLTLMALAGVSRSWRTVVAQIDVRDAELQFCTSDDATVGQRKGRSTSAEAGLEAAYKAASETGKARLLESAVRLLRHYRCANLGAATDAVLSQVPPTPVRPFRLCIVIVIDTCGSFACHRCVDQSVRPLRNRPAPRQSALQLVLRAYESVQSGAVAELAPVVHQSFMVPLTVWTVITSSA